jgi:hypothetical protein
MGSHDVQRVFVIFGDLTEDLVRLSRAGHVWLAGTAANQRAAEALWSASPDPTSHGVTTFDDHGNCAAALNDLLPMVDVHHAAWSKVHVRGLAASAVTAAAIAGALQAEVHLTLEYGGITIVHTARERARSQVAAASALALLERAAPGFRAYAESGENDFDRDSVHGLFLACSFFVQEREIAPATWEALAELVNQVVGGDDDELDNAACTCFLEGLAERDHPLDALLRGEALAYWRSWCSSA